MRVHRTGASALSGCAECFDRVRSNDETRVRCTAHVQRARSALTSLTPTAPKIEISSRDIAIYSCWGIGEFACTTEWQFEFCIQHVSGDARVKTSLSSAHVAALVSAINHGKFFCLDAC